MKKFLLISIFTLGCSPEASRDLDAGVDLNNGNDTSLNEDVRISNDIVDTRAKIPTAEECENYDNEKACLNAGCPIFANVSIVSYANGVCGEAAPGSICWTTETGDALIQGVETQYSRDEMDGTKTVVISSSGYSEVIGWERCSDQCICVDP